MQKYYSVGTFVSVKAEKCFDILGILKMATVKSVNPSFSKPFGAHIFYQRGGTIAPMNVKCCSVIETPLKVLEMLKLFT